MTINKTKEAQNVLDTLNIPWNEPFKLTKESLNQKLIALLRLQYCPSNVLKNDMKLLRFLTSINDDIELVFEKIVPKFETSAKVDVSKKYIGKKLFQFKRTKTKTVTLKDGTKKKKKIHTKVDSDWRTYFGSSDALLSDLESIGVEHFRREILHFCTSKASCSYIEAQEQFARNVLESDVYYNNQIMVRVHGNHIRNKALTVS
jgi:putative transposon-encoded protein